MYRIEFQPTGRHTFCRKDETLLEASRKSELGLASLCGGMGTCGKCRLRVVNGAASPPTTLEQKALSPNEIKSGIRLACQACPESDLVIYVPPESVSTLLRTQLEGLGVEIRPDPPVRAYRLEEYIPAGPGLSAALTEALQSNHGVACTVVDLEGLQRDNPQPPLEAILRQGEVIALRGSRGHPLLGLAVDLGTTKIAGYLVNLETGKTLATHGAANPQSAFGADLIARLTYGVKSSQAASELQSMAVSALNSILTDLCHEAGTTPDDILEAAVVGNTAMHHILLGLPLKQLATAPYEPALTGPKEVKARDISLSIGRGAYVYMPPVIAGFVGSDHLAVLLSTSLSHSTAPTLAIDIGTNTEVSLAANGRISTLSCASGPALEGARIKQGMKASPGAIERVRLDRERVEFQTIGDAPAIGICGSGILDAVAALRLQGIVDRSGRMQGGSRVRQTNGMREFVLLDEDMQNGRPAIVLTQGDIREVQLAKAAIRTGIDALLAEHDIAAEDVDRILVAGAFGSYIDIASAIAIGMLPDLPLERYDQIGNAAGAGARMLVASFGLRGEAEALAAQITHIDMAARPDFHRSFIRNTQLDEGGYLWRRD